MKKFLVCLVSLLFASTSFASARPSEMDQKMSEPEVRSALDTLTQLTTLEFWKNSLKVLEGEYVEKDGWRRMIGATGGLFGTMAVSSGVMGEVLMHAYGTQTQMGGMTAFYLEYSANFPRLGMKLFSESSATYARMAARAAANDAMMVRMAKMEAELALERGFATWAISRTGWRVLTVASGLAGATLLALAEMSGETAPHDLDMVPGAYYEKPESFVRLMAQGKSNDEIMQLVQTNPVIGAHILSMTALLKERQIIQ